MFSSRKSFVGSAGGLHLLSNTKVLIILALFIAISGVLGKTLAFTAGSIRISFENLTLIMSGILFGPIIGLLIGVVSDILGCFISGYTINPIITLGAGAIGFIPGIISFYFSKFNLKFNLLASVGLAHIIGSMIIKSIGLYVYFAYPIQTLLIRVPLYIVIGGVEFYIIYMLFNNKSFSKQIEKIYLNK